MSDVSGRRRRLRGRVCRRAPLKVAHLSRPAGHRRRVGAADTLIAELKAQGWTRRPTRGR